MREPSLNEEDAIKWDSMKSSASNSLYIGNWFDSGLMACWSLLPRRRVGIPKRSTLKFRRSWNLGRENPLVLTDVAGSGFSDGWIGFGLTTWRWIFRFGSPAAGSRFLFIVSRKSGKFAFSCLLRLFFKASISSDNLARRRLISTRLRFFFSIFKRKSFVFVVVCCMSWLSVSNRITCLVFGFGVLLREFWWGDIFAYWWSIQKIYTLFIYTTGPTRYFDVWRNVFQLPSTASFSLFYILKGR